MLMHCPQADDADTGEFGAQEYDIISGNDGDAFLLNYDGRELDLVVNADLDRERVDTYRLKIVALDGGTPPRTGTLTVNVNVQVNLLSSCCTTDYVFALKFAYFLPLIGLFE